MRRRTWMAWLGALALGSASPATVAEATAALDLRLTLRLSAPHGSEDQRALLRREYRLTQAAAEFWPELDALYVRIHATAQNVASLHAQLRDATPIRSAAAPTPTPTPTPTSLLPSASHAPTVEPRRVTTQSPDWEAWLLPAGGAGLALLALFAALRAKRRAPLDVKLRTPTTPSIVAPVEIVARRPPRASVTPPPTADDIQPPPPPPPPPATPVAVAPPPDVVAVTLEHTLSLAQVMLAYGRASSATRILRDYVAQFPTTSVWPWLKLLEAYRHMGLRDEFEQVGRQLNTHFNVRTPNWDEGVDEVPLRAFFDEETNAERDSAGVVIPTGLEQIPHISARVQAAWGTVECRDYLRMLLLDNRGGERTGFPVAVVMDILLLEDVLNELLNELLPPNN